MSYAQTVQLSLEDLLSALTKVRGRVLDGLADSPPLCLSGSALFRATALMVAPAVPSSV